MSEFSITVGALIDGLPVTIARGSAETPVTSITEDSRQVRGGGLFVARPGTLTDGRAYIDHAVARGAVAVLTAPEVEVHGSGVVHLVCDHVLRCAALLAERLHQTPSADLATVGVTGTNGKTTVAWLIHQLLNSAGVRCGLVGTVQVHDGVSAEPAQLTTPPAIDLSRMLQRMVRHGCSACAMEVSSHALAQYRTAGLTFVGSVFTNISGDHMDYHGTMESYVQTKARLFAAIPADGWAVINADDDAATAMIAASAGRVITTSCRDGAADCTATVRRMTMQVTEVRLGGPWGSFDLALPLVGRHNVSNALQAAAAVHALGVPGPVIREGLARCTAPPGRLEPVGGGAADITVLVDYAHTDDALANVLDALGSIPRASGRLWVVFGCGGDRDATKRPRMAQVACRGADEVVVTSDNPRTEDPARIIEAVLEGVPCDRRGRTPAFVDRAAAIEHAVSSAAPGDVVLIAGKGHEDYQIIGTTRRPFDDRLVAAAALGRRAARTPVGGAT